MNSIICVYQDCPMCGDRGKKLQSFAATHRLQIRKVSFACAEGQELIARAVYDHKIGKMPFYTDGVKFSNNIEDFVAPAVKPPKKAKRTKSSSSRKRKAKKEVEHESDN